MPLALTRAYEPLLYLNNPSSLSITPGSSFAARFRNAMLPPPSDNHHTFRLLAGLADPAPQCYGGTIGYADHLPVDSIRFNVQMSLIPATGRTFVNNQTITQTDAEPTLFGVRTDMQANVIPFELFTSWHYQLLAIAGVPNQDELATIDWSPFLHLLPSIQYTIYRSDESDEVAARILLQPQDFIDVLPFGANVMLLPRTLVSRCSLGLNALKRVGIFFDYENSRIGFCEPI